MAARPTTMVIACAVLAGDIRQVARENDLTIDLHSLPGGLHENPAELNRRLQAAIDEASDNGRYGRIVIGYGVCGRGTVDIRAGSVPLVIARVHDCIALLLGGDSAYRRQFKRYPGTYYISAGWHDEKAGPLSPKRPYVYMGSTRVYVDELVEKYGREHARDTVAFLNRWQKNYQRAAFIDTGRGAVERYARYARAMADKYGWRYERLTGDLSLIRDLLTVSESTADILVVPPGELITFDPGRGKLATGKILPPGADAGPTIEIVGEKRPEHQGSIHIGLGIDAGGTYTDAVIFDLPNRRLICKSKALTTPWDYAVGIREAMAGLDRDLFGRVQLTAVSTTLATNAVVENRGQPVGLLLMPPYGRTDMLDITHTPLEILSGQLEISGRVIERVNKNQVRRVVRRMVDQQGVSAFAVSGFAGSINPEHELEVKRIIRDETGCGVTCGHELSNLLNFTVRARTAVLNARIVPLLVRLLENLQQVLGPLGITAPVMVVKGDGSLMKRDLAMQRPVETILSGPAASIAGARFLTGRQNALVVDMGGTTTDTAALVAGNVGLCEEGANLGGHRTHVRALKVRTSGLGGDSEIIFKRGEFTIGPRRVAPLSWLGNRHSGAKAAVDYIIRQASAMASSEDARIFTLTPYGTAQELSAAENRIVELLAGRPRSQKELVDRTGALHGGLLPVEHLEQRAVIQRCGLTPTDLLHLNGAFVCWDPEIPAAMCNLLAGKAGMTKEALVKMLLDQVVRQLAAELIRHQLDDEIETDDLDRHGLCAFLIDRMTGNGRKEYGIDFKLRRPVIGIGAPIGHFLPPAARRLRTRAILPEHADVANAIGAITSHVAVEQHLRIVPNDDGGYRIEGLPGSPVFNHLKDADAHARQQLVRHIRATARRAGTSQEAVTIETEDDTVTTARGEAVFLGRTITGQLVGQPAWVGEN